MRRMNRQRGAIAVTVALLMVVMVGFTAIAVDAGAIWMDRKELQNSADAAALALAQSCAKGVCESGAQESDMAQLYADGNKRDADVTVDRITTNLGSQTVKVDVSSTRDHWFAPVLGNDSTHVARSATAAWGGIGAARVIPLTVSDCYFQSAFPSSEIWIPIVGTKDDPSGCHKDKPTYIPGGFGWLNADAECMTNTSVKDGSIWVSSDTGNDGPEKVDCNLLLQNLQGETVLIPVFDKAEGNGTGGNFNKGGKYRLKAYAQITISTYCFNQSASRMWLYNPENETCNGNNRWMRGTFVKMVDLGAELGGPSGYGATTIKLIA